MAVTSKPRLTMHQTGCCVQFLALTMCALVILFGVINVMPYTHIPTNSNRSKNNNKRPKLGLKSSQNAIRGRIADVKGEPQPFFNVKDSWRFAEFTTSYKSSTTSNDVKDYKRTGIQGITTMDSNKTNGNSSRGKITNDNPAARISSVTQSAGRQKYIKEVKTHQPDEVCRKRLPQAIVVGVQKCGTSALLFFLKTHPQIAALTKPQEAKFFSLYYKRGLEWYRNLMKCSFSNQITIEKSPPYYFRAYTADRIRKMDPKTKIIITVKDPVIRSLSMYAMVKRGYKNLLPFEELVSNQVDGKIKNKHYVIKWSIYVNYIKPWIEKFGLRQIHFVDGQNLEKNPAEEFNKIEEFLNIGSYFKEDNFIFNATKGKFCLKSGNTESDMLCMGSNKGRAHPVISDSLVSRLQNYFRPKNNDFFNIIGQEFDWGY